MKKKFRRTINGYSSEQTIKNDLKRLLRRNIPYYLDISILQPYRYLNVVAVNIGSKFGYELGIVFDELPENHIIYDESYQKFIKIATTRGFYSVAQSDIRPISVKQYSIHQNNNKPCQKNINILSMTSKNVISELINIIKYIGKTNLNLTLGEINLLTGKNKNETTNFLSSILNNIVPELDIFIKQNNHLLTISDNEKKYFQQNIILDHKINDSKIVFKDDKEIYHDTLQFLIEPEQEDENRIKNILKNVIVQKIPTKLNQNILSFYCDTEEESNKILQILQQHHKFNILSTFKNKLDLQKRFFLEEKNINSPRIQPKTNINQLPNNKKFSSELRNDPWFIKYYHEKLLNEVKKEDGCDNMSVETLVKTSSEVIVSLHPGKYQKCSVKEISKNDELIVIDMNKKAHHVPLHLFHVHPINTCQEISLGNAVFINNNSSNYYDIGHVVDINDNILTIQPWDNNENSLGGSQITVHEKEVIPMRTQLKKSDLIQKYPSMASYQKFVRSFQKFNRIQKGMLLYHEMGSGKSRTAIETMQSYFQERWFHLQKYKNITEPKNYVDVWGKSRWGILISPNSDAKNHFLDEISQWLSSHWTWLESKQMWIPFQKIFTSLTKNDIFEEMNEHTKKFRSFFIDSNQENRYPVIKTIIHDNTNNFYSIRKNISDRHIKHNDETSQKIRDFFGIEKYKNIPNDSHYSQFFSDSFIIIDEIHNVSNMVENAQSQDKNKKGEVGMFLYKALMEAECCKILGLTGTPIQRSAISVAPLFNILHGKIVQEKWGFSNIVNPDNMIIKLKNIFKKYVQQIWDHQYDIKKKELTLIVTPYPKHIDWISHYSNITFKKLLISHLEKQNIEFKKNVYKTEFELFPFAFKKGAMPTNKYTFDDLSFKESYIDNNQIIHVSDFIKRIIGFVSYIFPPKKKETGTKKKYPDKTVTTEKVVAKLDHVKYIREVRDCLQSSSVDGEPDLTGHLKRAGADAVRACNINWFAIADKIHQYPPIGQWLKKEGKMYGQQLLEYYYKFQNEPNFKKYLIHSDQSKDGKLEDFSPKMALILKDINNQQTPFENKSVLYSRWVDGTADTSAPLFRTKKEQELYSKYQDKNGIGFGGLKVFSIVLDLAGWICLEFEKRKGGDGNYYYYLKEETKNKLLKKTNNRFNPAYIRFGYLDKNNKETKSTSKNQIDIKSLQKAIFNINYKQDLNDLRVCGASNELVEDIKYISNIRCLHDKNNGNKYGELLRTILISASITEGIEFKHVRQMHILEPPDDYKTLDQMFSRSIRLNSHQGLEEDEKHVNIKVYMLTVFSENRPWEKKGTRQGTGFIRTADEINWDTIERKIFISEQFYSVMKYSAIDCYHNLINNQKSHQDKHLFCYDYPFENEDDFKSENNILFNPFKQPKTLKYSKIDLQRLKKDLKTQSIITKKKKQDTRLRIPYLTNTEKLLLKEKKICLENEKDFTTLLKKTNLKDIIYVGSEGSPSHSHIYQIWSSGNNKWNIRTLESKSVFKKIKGNKKDILKYVTKTEEKRKEKLEQFHAEIDDIEF